MDTAFMAVKIARAVLKLFSSMHAAAMSKKCEIASARCFELVQFKMSD